MAAADLTLEQARSALSYCPEDGSFKWTAAERKRRRSDAVGTIAANGYVMIRLAGKLRLAHRLAWLLHYGKWPSEFIDHINGDRADNRLENLRDVPHAANMKNCKAKPMLVGAIPAGNGKWRAAIHQYGEAEDLGKEFDTPEEANAAWLNARKHIKNPNSRRPQLRLR